MSEYRPVWGDAAPMLEDLGTGRAASHRSSPCPFSARVGRWPGCCIVPSGFQSEGPSSETVLEQSVNCSPFQGQNKSPRLERDRLGHTGF